VRRVRVLVDASVEDGGRVLADSGVDHRLSAGVLLDERGHVVDDAGDQDERAAIAALLLEVVELHHGQLLERHAPVEGGALAVDLLLELLDAALLDLVGTELLQVVGKAELLPGPDAPLGRVVLEPLDGIAVVAGELVVEVVVALSEGDERRDDVVAGRVAVVEGLVTEPVSERVDAEGGLLDEEDTQDAGIDEAAEPVAPSEAGNDSGEDDTHEDDDPEVVLVLPDDDGIAVQVRDVGASDLLGVLLHHHPADVRVHKTLADRVRVLLGVGVSVVGAVVPGPPADGALDGTPSDGGQVDLEGERSRVRRVGPETMVARRDAETGVVVVDDRPDQGGPGQWGVVGTPEAEHRDDDDQVAVEKVEVLPPVLHSHWLQTGNKSAAEVAGGGGATRHKRQHQHVPDR